MSSGAGEYAGHHEHCYIREGQHCSCGRRIAGVHHDRPPCTCQGLPMAEGQECHAHQQPATRNPKEHR